MRHEDFVFFEWPESDCALDLAGEISQFTLINDIMKRLFPTVAAGVWQAGLDDLLFGAMRRCGFAEFTTDLAKYWSRNGDLTLA